MQGTVERLERQGKRTAVKINGEWYSTFEPIRVSEGDRVEFTFTTVKKNGREYRNLKQIEAIGTDHVMESGRPRLRPTHDRGEEINRAVALKAALQWAEIAQVTDEESILRKAECFLAWLGGLQGKQGEER